MTSPPRPELLLATKNPGKVRELVGLLGGIPHRLRDLSEFPAVQTAEETGDTFEANAAIKARFYGGETGLLTLADDSGLEVDALGGAPGVHSARYAGESADDEDRIALLLRELGETENRAARFVCVVALYEPRRASLTSFRAECHGTIGREPRGQNGFGYDPVFIPRGFTDTFAELHRDVKQRISHRALAVAKAGAFLIPGLGAQP